MSTDRLALLTAALRQAGERCDHWCVCCGRPSGLVHTDGCLWPTVAPLLAEAPEPVAFDEAIVRACLAVPQEHRAEYRQMRRLMAETPAGSPDVEFALFRIGMFLRSIGAKATSWINLANDYNPEWRALLAACEAEEARREQEGA